MHTTRRLEDNANLYLKLLDECNERMARKGRPGGELDCRISATAMYEVMNYQARRRRDECLTNCSK